MNNGRIGNGLTLEELDRALLLIQNPPVYYLIDHRCPKTTGDGTDVVFGMTIEDKKVALMHPDLLPLFTIRAKEANLTPVRFEYKHHVGICDIADRIFQEYTENFLQLCRKNLDGY